jgi:transposase-like protein
MKVSKEEKAMWIEDWKRSGKKAWTYARENGLVPQTFTGWIQRETKNELGIVEVTAQATASMRNEQEILIEKGEIKIHIPVGIGCNELRTIFGALGSVV